jgi:transposase-like protein
MQSHPFADKFPLLEGEEFDALVASVKATGGNKDQRVLYRMVDGRPQVLDGRNRELACKKARVRCYYKQVKVKDEEVKDFILRYNVHRRHMTPELRRQIVAELRADGESTRQIAAAVGVSHTTVQNDLRESGGKNLPPEVQGRDGKTYAAAKPPTDVGDAYEGPILCLRCARIGTPTPPDCPKCAKARQAAANKRGQGPQKNGQQAYDWRPFRDHVGAVARQIDKMCGHYGAARTATCEAVQDSLKTFVAKFEAVYSSLSGTQVP